LKVEAEAGGSRAANWFTFVPGETTHVDITFIATGTGVTVEHTGWSKLRPDHPVRDRKGCSSPTSASGGQACSPR
jgi:hypothetical protein